jgi:EmrB/QacA subfamily drug resistance transporter
MNVSPSATPSEVNESAFSAAAGFSPRRRTAALIAVACAFVMDLLDTTIVNVAVPSIGNSLHASTSALEWIIAGYAVAFAVLLILGGRLGDSHGYRRMFLIGVGLFTLTSLVCGLAPSVGALEAGRLLQGASAALMVPQVMALVQVMYPPELRYRVYAVFGFLGGVSAALGPIVGGLLIDADWFGLGWRLAFLINLPVGAASLAAGVLLLPKGRGVDAVTLDLAGALLSVALLFAILLPLIEGPGRGWPLWTCATLASSLPLAWITWRYLGWRDAHRGHALVPPALLRRRRVALGLLCGLCLQPVIPGYLLVMTFVLQGGRGLSPTQMAYACAPIALGAMLGISLIGPRLHHRLGVYALLFGAGAQLASLLLVGWTIGQAALPLWALALGQLGMGIGLGLVGPPLSNATLADVPMAEAGAASGLLSAVQQLAGALGVALAGLLFFHGGPAIEIGQAYDYAAAYRAVMPLFIGLLLGGGLVCFNLARRPSGGVLPDPSRGAPPP